MKTTTITKTKPAVRVRSRTKAGTVVATTDLDGDLDRKVNAVAAAMVKISELQHMITEYTAELQPLMHSAGVTEHATKKGTAKLVTPKGRASTTIDPVEFEAAVDSEDFYASVKVQVTKAKEVLSGKQFKSLAQVTPAVPGKEKVVVTLPKVK